IVKHRLMNIRFFLTRSILYFVLIIIITGGFVGTLFAIGQFITETGVNLYLVTVLVSLFIVIAFDPIKRFIAKITDKIFFKHKIDYNHLLTEASIILSEEIELESLVTNFCETVSDGLKIKYSKLFLTYKDKYFIPFTELLKSEKERDLSKFPSFQDILISELNKNKEIIIYNEYESRMLDIQDQKEKEKMEQVLKGMKDIGADMVAPIFREGKINGLVMLGPTVSGDPFDTEDVRFLQVISPQVSSAIEKAKLFQDTQKFNINLQKEVDRATTDLKKANQELKDSYTELETKNNNLNILQKFSSLILQKMDFKEVAQEIIDSIPEDIEHCNNGLLTLIDKEKKYLAAYSIPQETKLFQKINFLIGDVSKYKISVKNKENLLAKAYREKKSQLTTDMTELISPPLPKIIAKQIAKLKPISKSNVVIPIISGDEVMGTLSFALSKEPDEISAPEMEMMSAVTRELGIAYERSQFYAKLNDINKELKYANEHLKDLDRAKSEFMSIASHQLRTPLSGIMGYLSMILEGDYGTLKGEQKKIINDVFEASQRLIRLVNIFLNVTRIEAGRFVLNLQKVDIDKLINDVLKELRPTANKKKIKLIFKRTHAKMPFIIIDPDKIYDVILNLVDNAIKYSQKGKIEIKVALKDKESVLITVKDEGVGIDPEDARKLFDKFVRGSGSARIQPDGSGLGLFIARRITEAHHGEIWVKSRGLGKGSTFHLLLPLDLKNN
ncbi:MAG: GAF domain-containing sensor histidine kinase, partial [Patescibacteria group bacterium]